MQNSMLMASPVESITYRAMHQVERRTILQQASGLQRQLDLRNRDTIHRVQHHKKISVQSCRGLRRDTYFVSASFATSQKQHLVVRPASRQAMFEDFLLALHCSMTNRKAASQ